VEGNRVLVEELLEGVHDNLGIGQKFRRDIVAVVLEYIPDLLAEAYDSLDIDRKFRMDTVEVVVE